MKRIEVIIMREGLFGLKICCNLSPKEAKKSLVSYDYTTMRATIQEHLGGRPCLAKKNTIEKPLKCSMKSLGKKIF